MRRAARIDANQPALVDELRRTGFVVHVTSPLGGGYPDITVRKPSTRQMLLVEIKDPDQPPSKRRLTPDEQVFHDLWQDSAIVAETSDDVRQAFKERA